VSDVYIIDTISPEMICMVRIIPSMNPMFHMYEIEVGVGRSSKDFFIIFISGFFFISLFFIRRKNLVFGVGGGRGLLFLALL